VNFGDVVVNKLRGSLQCAAVKARGSASAARRCCGIRVLTRGAGDLED